MNAAPAARPRDPPAGPPTPAAIPNAAPTDPLAAAARSGRSDATAPPIPERDKDDLLRAGFEDIRAALAAERDAAKKGEGRKVEFLQPMLVVFQHVGRHRDFWESLSRKGGADLVVRILRGSVSDLVREHFRSQFPDARGDQMQREAAMQFVTGACMGLLGWWLDNDVPYSAEELHSIFRRLATQGVRRFLATT